MIGNTPPCAFGLCANKSMRREIGNCDLGQQAEIVSGCTQVLAAIIRNGDMAILQFNPVVDAADQPGTFGVSACPLATPYSLEEVK